MVEVKDRETSHWWWFDSYSNTNQRRSPWLQSTIAELDKKTKVILKLIEEDADSFAQRAEMYYKKRPELINMVEDFYRAHRLLAERCDQFKSESGTRLLTPWASPVQVGKCPEKLASLSSMGKTYDSYSESYEIEDSESYEVSDVEDPEPEEHVQSDKEVETYNVSNGNRNTEVMKLREDIERLKEENRTQKEQLTQKDEEKREVIRQLTVAMDMIREENVKLRKRVVKNSPKKQNAHKLDKLKDVFWKKLFV